MIDMAGGGDDHGRSPGPSASASIWARKPASSTRQRRSSRSAPSWTRPTTGTGSARSAAEIRVSAAPWPRRATGWIASATLSSESTGSEPLPIWLRQGSTATEAIPVSPGYYLNVRVAVASAGASAPALP